MRAEFIANAAEKRYYRDIFGKPSDRETGVLHVSDLASLGSKKCFMRILGYWVRGETPYQNWHFTQWSTFQIGHAIHAMVRDQEVEARPYEVIAEARVEHSELFIAGNADLWMPGPGVVAEVKSSTDMSKKAEFWRQASLYGKLLGAERMLLLIQGKNGERAHELRPLDEVAIDNMLALAASVVSAKDRPLDKVAPQVPSGSCNTCPFKQACKPPTRASRIQMVFEEAE